MKKLVIGMVILMFVVFATPALATNSYLPVNDECIDGDLVVYSANSFNTPVGCLPANDVAKAEAEAVKYTSGYTGNLISVALGQKFLTTFGFVDTCPFWFPIGCVADPAIFVEWR